MTTTAQSIVLEVQTVLQDDGVRWPASEIVRYINDGQRLIASKRPDTKATAVSFACVAGHRQTLPSTAQSLIDIHTNASGQAVTKVERSILEAVSRTWTTQTPGVPVHFMHTLADPRTFYVYPPASSGTALACVFSNYPTDIPAPTAPGVLASTVTGNIDLPDEFEVALQHYAVFRCYSKDAEFGGNAALAAAHLQLFKAELGEQIQGAATTAPKE